MIFWNLAFILILIALNAFFVGVEFAVVASRRARLDLLSSAESSAGRIVRRWLENNDARDRLIAASQLGITVVSLALGAVGENTFEAILEPYFHEITLPPWLEFINRILPALPLVISLAIITSFHVVLGEQVPKVAVLRAPERFALASAPVMAFFSKFFRGFINLLDWSTRQILKMAGLPAQTSHSSMYSVEELKEMMAGPETEGVIEQTEREMLSAVIDFGELLVRQVLVPRTEIIALEADMPLAEVVAQANQHSVTKFPVYEDTLDRVIGILHVRDLLTAIQDPKRHSLTARSLVREALFVPETISVNHLLHEFRARRTHIAIVLDEFSGTAGLVTLEDLVEEIVGEFQDPFDSTPPAFQSMADGTFQVDGLTLIEEFNQHFGLHLVDPNYDTIAGYVLGRLGHIPRLGDVVQDAENKLSFKVTAMDHLRISHLSIAHMDHQE